MRRPSLPWRKPAATFLLWMAAAFSLGMAVLSPMRRSLPGCAEGADCGSIPGTAYGSLFGIPVSWLGLLVYGMIILTAPSWVRRERSLAGTIGALLSGVGAGGAVWFIFVQAFALGNWCPWCIAAHTCFLAAFLLLFKELQLSAVPDEAPNGHCHVGLWILGGSGASIALLALGAWQAGAFRNAPAVGSLHSIASVGQSSTPDIWKLDLDDQPLALDLNTLPVIGPRDASRTAVLLTDYTSAPCRTYFPNVTALAAAQNPAFRVLLLPAGLDDAGTDLHRVMLTLLNTNGAIWSSFHERLLGGSLEPHPAAVADAARNAVGNEAWNAATLAHQKKVEQALQSARQVYQINSNLYPKTATLPQLISGKSTLMGAISDPNKITAVLLQNSPPPAPPQPLPPNGKPTPEWLSLALGNARPSVGNVDAGKTTRVALNVFNSGTKSATLQRADLDTGLLIVSLPGRPIPPGQVATVLLDCQAPPAAGPFSKKVVLHTSVRSLHAMVRGTATLPSIVKIVQNAPLPKQP